MGSSTNTFSSHHYIWGDIALNLAPCFGCRCPSSMLQFCLPRCLQPENGGFLYKSCHSRTPQLGEDQATKINFVLFKSSWVVRTAVTQVTEYQAKSPISIHANLLLSVYIKVVIPNALFQLSLISCYSPSGQVSSLNCLCSIFPGPLSKLPHVSGNVHIIPVYMLLSLYLTFSFLIHRLEILVCIMDVKASILFLFLIQLLQIFFIMLRIYFSSVDS